MKSKHFSSLKSNENGFASLVIAIVLIIVLGLLTVGFAALMRHSQMQELNRHLSDQAYYAAESGVNDAVRAIHNGFTKAKTACGPVGPNGNAGEDSSLASDTVASEYLANNVLDANATDAEAPRWTCLLINPSPSTINYDSVDTINPKTVVFHPVNSGGAATPLTDLEIYWQGTDPNTTNFPNSSGSFPVGSSWTSVGVLRLSLTPLSSFLRNDLMDNTYTAFLYPRNFASASSTIASFVSGPAKRAQQGAILDGGCDISNKPKYCHVTITGIPSDGGNGYLISLRSIYSPTSVVIMGNGGNVNFTGAQTMIDATGKAQNILKRIQVRVPNKPDYAYPGFADDSASSICKKLSGYSGGPTDPDICS